MPSKHYPDVDANPNFPQIEQEILAHWAREGVFQQSIDAKPASNEFVFYDGPPFANGLPHYGHLLTGYVKDVFARYQTMRGKRVERRFGWDCHGLPAEMGSEKELGISGRAAITHYGIGKFNEHCRTSVMKYTNEWEAYVNRQARWVDFKNDYKTMDTNFMESVLWAFKQLYDKGLVYEAYRVMPYSWAAETPLSNFETKLDNSYREREDKAIYVAFELKEKPQRAPKGFKKYAVIAWTTTPWTLPSNLALAASKNVFYTYHLHDGTVYLATPKALNKIFGTNYDENAVDGSAENFTGNNTPQVFGVDLIGLTYKPLFPYFANHANAFKILDGSSFVTDGDGTGIVHMAPGFGEDDQKCCEANGIEVVVPVDGQGKYTDAIFDLGPRPPLEGGQTLLQESRGGYEKLSDRKYDDVALQHAKELRKATTEAERKLWDQLRGKQLESYKFRRQHPIGAFIADFYCPAAKLVIELDGGQHNEAENATYDAERTAFLEAAELRVLRFWNNDVMQNIEGVVAKIAETISTPPDSAKAESAPPQGGGLSLCGLNVIADTRKSEDEPYTEAQLKKFGLANLRIINYLKQTGQLIKQEDFKHNYPHCWRTDQPLIYRAMPSWYVEVTKFRDRAVELNQQINWIPDHIRDGQMAHMLATAPDWSISRNRFWGTPIPVWRSVSGDRNQVSEVKVFGSIAEIMDFFSDTSHLTPDTFDLHRPFIDTLTTAKDGSKWQRVEDVFDCWFESGSMPFAQVHYPFENKEWFETHFPADFITEYVGQTRGWFNTLIMLSTALFDKPPFKNCICHGVVLDAETGLKYSKRLKNYKDPLEVINVYGADALRWMMIASPVMRGSDLMVDPDGKFIRDVVRLAIKPIWNAYNFFCLYANADGVVASRESLVVSENLMDRYIIAKCNAAVAKIQISLDAYDSPSACDAVMQFFEVLNNWYIRRSKERFWSEEKNADKQTAYDTLYHVLVIMCKAAAPLLPLTLDEIYRGLTGEKSVHLLSFPECAKHILGESSLDRPRIASDSGDDEVMNDMDWAQSVCNAALAIRNKLNIRVRQPLAKLQVVGNVRRHGALVDIICDEVNVKSCRTDETGDINQYATLKLSINSQVLGKRLPAMMKQILPASKKGEWKQVDGTIEICGEKLLASEYTLQLEPKPEYAGRAQALSTNDALVILDTTITPELEAEGVARDLVRAIQQARKDAGLHVADKILLHINASDKIMAALATHGDYIAGQTLCSSIEITSLKSPLYECEIEMDEAKVKISLAKAA